MTEDPPGTIYGFEVKTIGGQPKSLSQYKGQVLLLVNTASLCGFTPQYEELEALYRRYQARGLRVLGFPANEFGAQEPGSDPEIQAFCRTRYAVSFDLFSKITVKGPGIHPLYEFLTARSGHNGDIPWNFTKFLAGRDGRVVARFGPQASPIGRAVTSQIESLLEARLSASESAL
ncbi:MAG: glutathione peroxidase [Elusimicrobia bacterium]|nr:glutathione peroxidase [Elusimicrobiota bacterium]